MPQLRFRPPWWIRVFVAVMAPLVLVNLALDPSLQAVIWAVYWVGLVALWCFGRDTVVDDAGIRTAGRWFRERIAWTDVEAFAVDRPTGKPELVLAGGQRKRLTHVPDSAWIEIQQRWQRSGSPRPPSDIRSAIRPNGSGDRRS